MMGGSPSLHETPREPHTPEGLKRVLRGAESENGPKHLGINGPILAHLRLISFSLEESCILDSYARKMVHPLLVNVNFDMGRMAFSRPHQVAGFTKPIKPIYYVWTRCSLMAQNLSLYRDTRKAI